MPNYEKLITNDLAFPVEAFIQDNLFGQINVDEHWHDCFEILFILNGTAVQIIDNKSYSVKEGDIILIKSGNIHSTYCMKDEDTKILVLKFMPSLIDYGYTKLDESKYIAAFLNVNSKEILSLSSLEKDEIKKLFMNIIEEYKGKRKSYDLCIKGYILQLMAFLVRYDIISIPKQIVNHFDVERIGSVIKYMEENYAEDIKLINISDKLNMNYSYVSRYFKKVIGKSFKSYFDYIRVCEADKKMMLKDRFIYEIAAECGFSSVQAFNRIYKRIKGAAPTESKKVLSKM